MKTWAGAVSGRGMSHGSVRVLGGLGVAGSAGWAAAGAGDHGRTLHQSTEQQPSSPAAPVCTHNPAQGRGFVDPRPTRGPFPHRSPDGRGSARAGCLCFGSPSRRAALVACLAGGARLALL